MSPPLQAGYPSVGLAAEAYQTAHIAYSVLQHGKTVAEAGPDTQRAAFLIALNNMRTSADNIAKLKHGLADEFARHLAHLKQHDLGKLEHSTSQLDDLCHKFAHAVTIGLQKLVDSAFKSKLKHKCVLVLSVCSQAAVLVPKTIWSLNTHQATSNTQSSRWSIPS